MYIYISENYMPYKRFPRSRKPYMPRKRQGAAWYNKKYSTVDLAKRAWSMAKYLRSLINVEHQKADFTIVNGGQSTTPTVVHLSAIAVGDSEGSRTGNSILCKYLYMKGSILMNSSALATKCRLIILRDKQQVGDTSPAMTDVYEGANTLAFLNKNTVGRFDILYDKTFNLDSVNNQIVLPDKYIRLNSHVRYNGTASSDVQKGGLYSICISDQATNVPTVSASARLMYIDN